jgi:predicted MFS family arabinose efflux permease
VRATGEAPPRRRSIWQDLPFIVAAALGFSVASIHFYSFGLFMKPLQAEYGWSRSQISGALVIVSIVGVAGAPFIGMLIDRWGSRRVGLPGVVAYCASLASLALARPTIWSFWASYLLIALSILAITATVWTRAVAARYEVGQRGLAIALALCGSCLGMLVAPLVANFLIGHYGWRSGYVGLGALFAVLSLPMILIYFHDAPARAGQQSAPTRTVIDIAPREALRSVRFWCLVVASLIASVATLALVTHLVPLLTDAGIATSVAAAAASTIGITSAIGRVAEGFLLDRFKGPAISAISLLVPTLACLLILFVPPSAAWAFAIALILGTAVGADVNIMAYLTSRYFGVRHYGVLFGIVYSMCILGGGLGPLLAGTIFDRTGNYDALAWVVLPLCVLCALLVLTLGPFPEHEEAAVPAVEPQPATS